MVGSDGRSIAVCERGPAGADTRPVISDKKVSRQRERSFPLARRLVGRFVLRSGWRFEEESLREGCEKEVESERWCHVVL